MKINRLLLKFLSTFCALAIILGIFAGCDSKKPSSEGSKPSSSSDETDDGFFDDLGDDSDTTSSIKQEIGAPADAPKTYSVNNGNSTRGYTFRPSITEIMPVIHIQTDSGTADFATNFSRNDKLQDLIPYEPAKITVSACEPQYELKGVDAEVKVRGNYTLDYEKKPIRIKFNKKQGMLGLNGEKQFKNWVLLADWKDFSMSNNTVAFYLGNTILGSDGLYTSDYRNVELYINGEYWGVYLLAEQQEAKDGRTSVPDVPKDYTGTDIGYFFEYDVYHTDENKMPNNAGDPTFTVDYGTGKYYQKGYTVKSDINDDAQLRFLKSYVQNAFKIAQEATTSGKLYKFNDTYTGLVQTSGKSAKEVIGAAINIDSIVDMYIISEICRDPDIAQSSFFLSLDMTKEGDKRVTLEAVWDFDSGLGIKNDSSSDTDDMYVTKSANPWLRVLADQDWFINMVKKKWKEIKAAGVLDNAIKLVAEQKNTYKNYYAKNYERWERRVGWGDGILLPRVVNFTQQSHAASYLEKWLDARFKYLDSQWS